MPFVEFLEPRRLLSTVLSAVGAQPVGPLTGKIVYTSGGHGFTAGDNGVWSTQRGEVTGTEMVEDLGNVDQMGLYADQLWRAGATVVPMRPVGDQVNEVVIDNLQATYTGVWTDATTGTYFSTANGSGTRYRTAGASATETAVAKFTPNIPQSGFYPIYAWTPLSTTNGAADQLYRINHSGGATEVKVNHARVGNGWIYLGTYYLRAGTSAFVEVSNRSSSTGKTIAADAIRFGNGMGTVTRDNVNTTGVVEAYTSGLSRQDESALYWVEAQAGWTAVGTRVASSNWRSSASSDDDANVSAPLKWARYMNAAPLGQSVYVSFHSNAGGGRGTVGLYNREDLFPGTATPNQFRLAQLVGKELNDDFVALGSPPLEYAFFNRSNPTTARSDYAFGEIRGDTSNYEFDATILEVAFHDDVEDAAIMRDPIARDRVAQSTTQATIRYFNEFGGGVVAFAPDAPTNLRTSADAAGNITLRWNAPATSAIFGGAPTGYRIYASRDGYGFDGGITATGTSATFPRSQIGSGTVFFKVVATNAGGESPASPVVATRVGDSRMGRILIVDGFDRQTRQQNFVQSVALNGTNNVSQGTQYTIERVRPRYSNSFDYSVQHALAIANHPGNLGFDTVDNAAVIGNNVNLSNYRAVIWILGEESTANRTFDSTEQVAVSMYLNGGGKLFASGAEIGWDLQARGNGPSFFNNTLRTSYASDDANTYAASGVAGSIFAGISLAFDDGTGETYDVDFADRLTPTNGSTALMSYTGGSGGTAATGWFGANGAASIVMGFPFETITDRVVRANLMRRVLDSFGFNSLAPTPSLPLSPAGQPIASAAMRATLGSSKKSVVDDVLGA